MILCFDIGGSRIKAGLAGPESVTPLGDTPTPLTDLDAFLLVLDDCRHVPHEEHPHTALSAVTVFLTKCRAQGH